MSRRRERGIYRLKLWAFIAKKDIPKVNTRCMYMYVHIYMYMYMYIVYTLRWFFKTLHVLYMLSGNPHQQDEPPR